MHLNVTDFVIVVDFLSLRSPLPSSLNYRSQNVYCKNHHQRQLLHHHHHHQFRHNAAAANSHYWPNTNHKGKAKITKKREQYHNKISKRTILITRETKTTTENINYSVTLQESRNDV